ncbi:hypothetical protein [uncultured Sutterella sp.]|uniref:hypothetical protein n=1 Tax=uncultured Sutterella sp. TaxID=286133 RepID=UPI002633674B|nr:hypothetical protein [uncultured Sutterella sp.]
MRKQSPVGKALERIVFNPEDLRISVYGVADGIARLSKAGAAEKDILVFIESALPEKLVSEKSKAVRSAAAVAQEAFREKTDLVSVDFEKAGKLSLAARAALCLLRYESLQDELDAARRNGMAEAWKERYHAEVLKLREEALMLPFDLPLDFAALRPQGERLPRIWKIAVTEGSSEDLELALGIAELYGALVLRGDCDMNAGGKPLFKASSTTVLIRSDVLSPEALETLMLTIGIAARGLLAVSPVDGISPVAAAELRLFPWKTRLLPKEEYKGDDADDDKEEEDPDAPFSGSPTERLNHDPLTNPIRMELIDPAKFDAKPSLMRRFTGPGYLALKIGLNLYLDEKSGFWPSVNRLLKE